MSDKFLVTIAQLDAFTQAADGVTFVGAKRKEKYAWVEKLLARFFYFSQRKKNKATIRRYVMKMTGYEDAQVTRLIRKKKKTHHILPSSGETRSSFKKTYTTDDIARLLDTDDAHGRLSGKATREIFRREFELFKKQEYLHLKDISVSHLYNLRGTRQYISHASTFTKTCATPVNIGERRKPYPDGKPGYIRIDTVHQGDQEYEKGVYHINLVDEVTQWEMVGCVEGISERFLMPLLEKLLVSFPFKVIEFHSDNGSEFVNHTVAKLLTKLFVHQSKSRPRRCNDNALVEGKNGSVIRKHMGYIHIQKHHAKKINDFYETHFNVYVNFHRPSGYATTTVNAKGREKKIYNLYETPYEHFKKIPKAESFLRDGIPFKDLDLIAYAMSDNDCATLMQRAKTNLFKSFRD